VGLGGNELRRSALNLKNAVLREKQKFDISE